MRIGRFVIGWLVDPEDPNYSKIMTKRDAGIWWYLPINMMLRHYIKKSRKLMACKVVKQRKGIGLKEAKSIVDNYSDYMKRHNII